METLSTARRKIVKDLARPRHMSAVSAVVLGTIFMPLLGMPDIYEVPAFHSAMDHMSSAHVRTRDDEAARERMLASVIGDSAADQSFWRSASDRRPVVRRIGAQTPDQDALVAMIAPEASAEPLPAAPDAEVIAPMADEEPMAVDEEDLEAIEEAEEPMLEEDVEAEEKL